MARSAAAAVKASLPEDMEETSNDEDTTSSSSDEEMTSDGDGDTGKERDLYRETRGAAARALHEWTQSQSNANDKFYTALRQELALAPTREAQWILIEEMIRRLQTLSQEHRKMVAHLMRFLKASPSYMRSERRLEREQQRKEKSQKLTQSLWVQVELHWGASIVRFLQRVAMNRDFAGACKAMCRKDPSFSNWVIRINREVYKRLQGQSIRISRVAWNSNDAEKAARAFEDPIPLTSEQLQEIGAKLNKNGIIMAADLADTFSENLLTQDDPQEESAGARQRSGLEEPTQESAADVVHEGGTTKEDLDYMDSLRADIEQAIFNERPLSGDLWEGISEESE